MNKKLLLILISALFINAYTNAACASKEQYTIKETAGSFKFIDTALHLILKINGKEKSVGSLSYQTTKDTDNQNIYNLHSFYVKPQYRNKGYAKLLLDCMLEYLKNAGASKVFIMPGPFEFSYAGRANENLPDKEARFNGLVKLYKNFGFKFVKNQNYKRKLQALFQFDEHTNNTHLPNVMVINLKSDSDEDSLTFLAETLFIMAHL